jgi:hypothetical protein
MRPILIENTQPKEAAMSKHTVQSFPVARARKMRALYEMVRNRKDWRQPINASVDEPAMFAYLPDPQRQVARESMMRDLQQAVTLHTGEATSVFVAVNGNAIRYHVRAGGYRAPAINVAATKLFE